MATKDQERAALDKIAKIVNGLGEESYVGAAFKGCFEIAKDNICNDFMCSPLDRVEALEKRCVDLTRKNTELYDKNRQLSKRDLGDDGEDALNFCEMALKRGQEVEVYTSLFGNHIHVEFENFKEYVVNGGGEL